MLRKNVRLAPYTTIGLGGPARYFASCTTIDDLRHCLRWSAAQKLPVQVLGGGSNTLFADEGFAGLVLHVGLRGLDFADDGRTVQATAAAGEDWDAFVGQCVRRGLSGVECLSGIPGQAGATPIQNVGAYGQEVGETIVRVRALDRQNLELVEFAGRECGFEYRRSRFKSADQDRYIVVAAVFELHPQGRPALRYPELCRYLDERLGLHSLDRGVPALTAVRDAVLELRRRKSMVVDPQDPNSRSLGSFFLNPVLTEGECSRLKGRLGESGIPTFPVPGGVKVPAAWLVERAGFFKGQHCGGAAISEKHTLALVNRGGTTRELLTLAARIEDQLQEQFGIRLEREPVVVGGTRPPA